MFYKKAIVFDLECDGLLDVCTKIHCLSYYSLDSGELLTLTDYQDIINLFSDPSIILIGHNVIRFDIPVLRKILGINISNQTIDTLGISWVLQPKRKTHGLEEYGVDYGIPKPKIVDWSSLSVEDYIFRCEQDTRINLNLWNDQYKYLKTIYEEGDLLLDSYLKYLEFNLNCARRQEETGIKLDIEKCQQMIEKLNLEKEEKVKALIEVMPKNKIYDVKNPPKNPTKKDGSLSANGEKWMRFLEAHNLPLDHSEPVTYVKSLEDANPNSVEQKKEWLYSLGWVPENIKFDRNKETNVIKQIPQLKNKDVDKAGEVCDSIKALFQIEPKLELLEGLTILTHRISVFEGFIRDSVNGRLYPTLAGFTNTLRWKHSKISNLTSVLKPYGSDIRSCLIADEGFSFIGSDITSLEDSSKRHFLFFFDPEYVKEMIEDKTYDPHLDLAQRAGYLTQEQVLAHKNKTEDHTASRYRGKQVNFSATYKVGYQTLARNAGISEEEAIKLLATYWERNKGILDIEKSIYIKTIGDQMWLKNPLSKFYYSLRNNRDIFSTLNQGSGSYIFNVWILNLINSGVIPVLQYHDEGLVQVPIEQVLQTKEKIKQAMVKTNQMLKLNVEITCDSKEGLNYASCH